MRRVLLFLMFFFLYPLCGYSMEFILPKEKQSIVNTDYAFFVGKASGGESLSINDNLIYIAPNGAFAHTVKLNDGENRIIIRSNYGMQVFKIYKTSKGNNIEIPFEELDRVKAYVNCDNTPLRKTPIDGGLNRIGHLFKDTELVIDGSKGDFYRVILSKDNYGWIKKKDVRICSGSEFFPAEFLNMKNEQFKNATVQSITFSKKLPYTVEDNEKEILFKVYNPELSDSSVYTLNIPKPKKYTYNVKSEDGSYEFKVREMPKAPNECTVVVDAGHGGAEKGAIGCLGDEEKDINLKIAQELQKALSKRGFNVIMTREVDCNIGLNERTEIAKENDADIFVSIHLNSIGDVPMNVHKTRGTSVYYFNKNSTEFTEKL